MSYWIKTKTNRLKAPKRSESAAFDSGLTWEGLSKANIGDYVYWYRTAISAGTVGRLVSLTKSTMPGKGNASWATVETLDGKTKEGWDWFLSVIDYSAVQEVKDFYISDGRPERIKVIW